MINAKRKTLIFIFSAISTLFSRKILANGNPYRDRFQSYRQTFRIEPNKEETERIIKNIIKGREISKNLVKVDLPDTVEDGNVVPITFRINCSMSENDYPTKVHILALDNPFPEVAIYEFFPNSGEAEVSFRFRMRASSYVMVLAEMIDGRIGLKKRYVDVMLGACS